MARRACSACSACKKHKRKCDKRLPVCSLCDRTERACEYDETPKPPPSADEFEALQARITDLEARLSSARGSTASVVGPGPTPPSTASSPASTNHTTSSTRFPYAMFLDLLQTENNVLKEMVRQLEEGLNEDSQN
ncbi:hypothetical protein PENSUB_6095 [Penicillium subrubescens]|uniref:Zn(2)-C6 fungal-type domain-containing protein n=1 Tax=Penicillium subrubescens TaxID=1316194 RepID=A0A1Q5U4V4_9EURO|nr:hypothetical protein PENSUB_6095 [Penicillium subrubescens]